MSSYKILFKGNLVIDWSLEYKPSRKDIKESIVKSILKMSPEELAENLKIESVEENIN